MKMYQKLVVVLLIFTISSCSSVLNILQSEIDDLPSDVYHLDKTHASLIWKVSHFGLSNYTARFTDFDATINLDAKNVSNSSVTAKINPFSIETDYPKSDKKDFNKTLSEDTKWFNGIKFPEINFKSTNIMLTSGTTAIVSGDLKMLGIVKPIKLDVTFNGAYEKHPFSKKPTIGFSATGKINRSDWGLNTHFPMIANEVKIIIEAEFYKKDAL